MSSALAIAAVTRVIVDLLDDAIKEADLASLLGSGVEISSLPPKQASGGNSASPSNQLSWFLHQVSPNLGWQGADLPVRDSGGRLTANQFLPLDLHYLLIAAGVANYHSEIILGEAMMALQDRGILSRAAVGRVFELPPGGGALSAIDDALRQSGLADQVERIKITPENLGIDDLSKIWTALQTPYRTTAAYRVSVVLMEKERPKRSPLPVRSRGPVLPATTSPIDLPSRERGVVVDPSLLPPFPTLESLELPSSQPAIRMGERLILKGHHLEGDKIFVRFVETRQGKELELDATAGSSATRVEVQVPSGAISGSPPPPGSPLHPESWRAGMYRVSLRIERPGTPGSPRIILTNELGLLVAPRIATMQASAVAVDGITTFTVTVRPPVHPSQVVSLILGDRELLAEPIGSAPSSDAVFKGSGIARPSKHWVRLRVDGVESLLIDRSTTPPSFDPTQELSIS
jgi:hypothetical protein